MKRRKFRSLRRVTDSWMMSNLSSEATGVEGMVWIGIEYAKDVPLATTVLPDGELTVTVSESPQIVDRLGNVSDEVVKQLTAWVIKHRVALQRHWSNITDTATCFVEMGILSYDDVFDNKS